MFQNFYYGMFNVFRQDAESSGLVDRIDKTIIQMTWSYAIAIMLILLSLLLFKLLNKI